jgi:hypothetical protein
LEPSNAITRRNGYQTEGRRPALRAGLRPQLELWLGWLGHGDTVLIEKMKVHILIGIRARIPMNIKKSKSYSYILSCF